MRDRRLTFYGGQDPSEHGPLVDVWRPSFERALMIGPVVQFGRPVLSGTRIPTETLVERYNAGEYLEALARDYGQEEEQIEAAIVYESAA